MWLLQFSIDPRKDIIILSMCKGLVGTLKNLADEVYGGQEWIKDVQKNFPKYILPKYAGFRK